MAFKDIITRHLDRIAQRTKEGHTLIVCNTIDAAELAEENEQVVKDKGEAKNGIPVQKGHVIYVVNIMEVSSATPTENCIAVAYLVMPLISAVARHAA